MSGQLWPLPATVLLVMLLPDYAAVRYASATRPNAMAVISTYASRGSVAIPAGGFGGTLQTVADRIGMYVELLGRGLERTANFRNVETVSSVGSSGPALSGFRRPRGPVRHGRPRRRSTHVRAGRRRCVTGAAMAARWPQEPARPEDSKAWPESNASRHRHRYAADPRRLADRRRTTGRWYCR